MKSTEEIIDELIFEPVNFFYHQGKGKSIVRTNYNGVDIIERITYPYNVFAEPIYSYSCDLLMQLDSDNFGLVDISDFGYYCADGYGYPETNTLENIIDFIKLYQNEKRERRITTNA